jgi:hypothetical protein
MLAIDKMIARLNYTILLEGGYSQRAMCVY